MRFSTVLSAMMVGSAMAAPAVVGGVGNAVQGTGNVGAVAQKTTGGAVERRGEVVGDAVGEAGTTTKGAVQSTAGQTLRNARARRAARRDIAGTTVDNTLTTVHGT
ncbi:hypothetical protein FQN49_008975, partial [Arthroderma sp. PD_2]